jgi:D-alanine--poly(phosphoribitol) ligase subunit 2
MTKLEKEIYDFIKSEFDIEDDDEDFTTDINIFDYGYVDSLGATEIILFLEEHYSIELTQKDLILYPMNTVTEIASVVEIKISQSE